MNKFKNILKALAVITATIFIMPGMALAGNIDPLAAPNHEDSAMIQKIASFR